MRWGRAFAVVAVVLVLVACGGGSKKSNATASGSGSNGSQPSAGSAEASAADSGSAATATDANGDVPVVGADQGQGGAQGATRDSNGDAPVPPGLKPFAGTYAYHATGTMSLNGPPSNADVQATTKIEDLSDTDQRSTATGGGGAGDQVTVLRYSSDKIELVSLEMTGAVHKTFNGPVLYAPTPGSMGQTWAWDLTSTDNLTHIHQSSRLDRAETLTVGGQSVDTLVIETDLTFSGDINGSGHLTTSFSPVYKVAVRNHSTLDATYATYATFHFTSDITADLLDLRPS